MAEIEGFREWLSAHLARHNISQAALARAAKLSEAYVSQILSGERRAREADTQTRIAQALGMTPQEMRAAIDGEHVRVADMTEVERAIRGADELTAGQRRILLDTYYELRGRRPVRHRPDSP